MMNDIRTVKDYHRGNGTLRGGGVQRIYNSGPSLKTYKNKLDHRLGYCITACLLTIATILFIFGLFHQGVHEELTVYISKLRSKLIEATLETTSVNSPSKVENSEVHISNEDNNTSILVTTVETAVFPETCVGSEYVNESKCLTPRELQEDWNLLHRSYITLWELAALNLIIFVLILPLTCVFNSKSYRGKTFKLFYRGAIILSLFYLFAQCLYFIKPLLISTIQYPRIVKKLFLTKEPRDSELLEHIESRYACQFQFNDALVRLNLQQPCVPRIMDSLLPPYVVGLLIFIDVLPFLFAIYIYAWDACIKDSFLCQKARRQIEMNNQNRPQSREDIFRTAMAEPRYE